MKRFFLTAIIALGGLLLSAQNFIITNQYIEVEPSELSGLNKVFLLKSLTNPQAASITYTVQNESKIEFVSFDETGTQTSEQTENNVTSSTFYLDGNGNSGYIVKVDDVDAFTFWIIDYSSCRTQFNSVSWEELDDKCDYLKLVYDVISPEIKYYNLSGNAYSIDREYEVFYNSLNWNEESNEYSDEPKSIKQKNIVKELSIEAPLKNTKFYLLDDQFSIAFGYKDTLISAEYNAIAVQTHLVAKVITRDGLNELDRELKDETSVKGSAPLNINFTSNPNKFDGQYLKYYEWIISDVKDFSNYMYKYPDENLNFTFNNSDTYYVKVSVSNEFCTKSDSIEVIVTESQLLIPNVFTPNGDGHNDEFRVVYRSLIKFHGIIFNRWGEKVFEWEDPAKGWDGYFRRKLASSGAYYYIIDAEGSDGIKYKRKGDINLLRGKE